jgi:hypothetical protein
MCNVVDAEDGNSSFPATLSAVTGPNAADGIGSQTASCSYTDQGGLPAPAISSVSYGIVDPSAPTILGTLNPADADGLNGWYKSNVALAWTVTESESPNSLAKTGCVNQNITADQAETSYSCAATSAGGTATPATVMIKRDATAPTITPSRLPAANAHGWNNSAVTVSFACADATSGLAGCTEAQTLSDEGANQSSNTGNASDNAGNTASANAITGINIDKTAPTVSLVGGPANGSVSYFAGVPTAPTCEASDALSGLDGTCSVSGYSTAIGTHRVTATAKDKAGNTTTTAVVTYEVKPWAISGFFQPTDMGGIINTVKAGATIPLKFTVAAGTEAKTAVSDIKSFVVNTTTCPTSAAVDEIELTTTGGTSLRYDATAAQFVQNWQTPKAGCYKVTLTTLDGSAITALFKTR